MRANLTRREFSALLGLGLGLGLTWPAVARAQPAYPSSHFRMRTITAGVPLSSASDLTPLREAADFLRTARDAFVRRGIEVQTLRMATQPLAQFLPEWNSAEALDALAELDRLAVGNDIVLSVGPVDTAGVSGNDFARWAVELIRRTQNISFTCAVTTPQAGIDEEAVRASAAAMHAIAHETAGGEGNFRFAAGANIPAGTPFFPAAWFDAGKSFSVGLESPNLLAHAFRSAAGIEAGNARLAADLAASMTPIEQIGEQLARDLGWQYLGIDTSPAPGLDASIGAAIEALTGAPFGSPATLAGCAAITRVLKSLPLRTCGYSGLMLPVLEDTVLAQRAAEGRYGVAELLLYSSVCGTGLDVVPLPGDTPVESLAAVITDVAALSATLQKPLSARLFPVPGKRAGETVSFDNPYLTDAVVMPL